MFLLMMAVMFRKSGCGKFDFKTPNLVLELVFEKKEKKKVFLITLPSKPGPYGIVPSFVDVM